MVELVGNKIKTIYQNNYDNILSIFLDTELSGSDTKGFNFR
jgi:hypothetical protein